MTLTIRVEETGMWGRIVVNKHNGKPRFYRAGWLSFLDWACDQIAQFRSDPVRLPETGERFGIYTVTDDVKGDEVRLVPWESLHLSTPESRPIGSLGGHFGPDGNGGIEREDDLCLPGDSTVKPTRGDYCPCCGRFAPIESNVVVG
ncbi:hypothetical protein [Haloferula sp. A504]|uniref:hypothetical protein n=1 Tax=Haloferula sp. A504 TaxID=3373601 RepID=UPI0031BEE85C|nr:hypothetical protein [Verrucomicrobiaceae bacterium E54]